MQLVGGVECALRHLFPASSIPTPHRRNCGTLLLFLRLNILEKPRNVLQSGPGRLGKDQTGWGALGKRLDADEDFIGKNPMFAGPVEALEESNPLQHSMPARPRRTPSFAARRAGRGGGTKRGGGGPSSDSPSRLMRRSSSSYSSAGSIRRSYSESGYPEFDTGLTATTVRGTRRPVRAFQRLDEDVYDRFLNCTKKSGWKSTSGL